MMRDIATAMDGFCVAVTKGRAMWRFWDGSCKDRLLEVLAKKKSVPQAGAA